MLRFDILVLQWDVILEGAVAKAPENIERFVQSWDAKVLAHQALHQSDHLTDAALCGTDVDQWR